ncbi:Uncharacterised protein [Halioglobus japonicus]|nr:Uncharacterised protein [Halioglobus japonicus]
MGSEYHIVWAMLFGAVGFGYFWYGRKQQAAVPFVSGIALFVFPYFVSNVYALVGIGFALMALPYFIRI